MIMNLKTNTLNIKINFEFEVYSDIEITPKHVIDTIAHEIRIKKNYDGFSINGLDMNYEVEENPEMEKV